MALIENSKIYSGNDLENIFFRPMIAENGIADQGVRVLFNMPVPTTIHLWSASEGVLKPYESMLAMRRMQPMSVQMDIIGLNIPYLLHLITCVSGNMRLQS